VVRRARTPSGEGPISPTAEWLLWSGIGLSILLGIAGSILTPTLAPHHPIVMLWLDAADRNLLLARHSAVVPYVIVGTLRRLASDPLFFLAGHWYGDRALARLEPHLGTRTVRTVDRLFQRAAYPCLIAFTGRVVSTLAGIAEMPVGAFVVIAVVRTLAVVMLFRWLGGVLGSQIDSVLHVFNAYLIPSTIVVAVLALGGAYLAHRREQGGVGR